MSLTTTSRTLPSSCMPGYEFDRGDNKMLGEFSDYDSDLDEDDQDWDIECTDDGEPIKKTIEIDIGTIKYYKYYKPVITYGDENNADPGSIVGDDKGLRLILPQFDRWNPWPLNCVELGRQDISFYKTEECDYKYGRIDLDDLFERISAAFKK